MDNLHSVLRAIRSETKAAATAPARHDHLNVFREFLAHLDKAARSKPGKAKSKARRRR